jgi:signal transduction histidine kinase
VSRTEQIVVVAVVVGAVAALLIAVFGAVILALGRPLDAGERDFLAAALVAGAVTAVLAGPVRRRAAASVERRLRGQRLAADQLVDAFRSRFSRAVPLDELLLQLAENLREALELSSAEVWRSTGDALELAVSEPEREPVRVPVGSPQTRALAHARLAGEAWARVWLPGVAAGHQGPLRLAAVTHAGELHGVLVATRPGGARPFSSEEDLILAELARHVGLALHNLRLDSALQETLAEVHRQAEELLRSRARVVAAADAERRRIERDLHDGAQQHLIGIAAKCRLAHDLIERDPMVAAELLTEVGGDIETTLDDLRELAHGIFPSLLAEGGLAEAIPAAVRRLALPVTVTVAVARRYPPAVEAAVYFCCLEALQNAAKHAGAGAAATVDLREDGSLVWFAVADTGVGFDARSAAGRGLASMSDRVGAVGGSLRVDSAPGGGTRVEGIVPL